MALLLAPYNEAMRLGMGFNSFTQQLCVNDAVKLAAGKQLVSETDLRPLYKKGTMTGTDGGNVKVVQEVTWTAKFVDRLSEVTDSLNVSGSLQIKCDAIGGGGSASASFVDTNKFKESDINYLIQVRVTNQRLVASDLTEFDPIPNIPDSEFTRVYGDSFISGFTEGGEFSALVSIKLKDHSKAREIRGQLQVDLDFKTAQVSGSAAIDMANSSNNIDGETTISVSWRGGGDIKDENVNDWDLATLKATAMEFPEHVMACPLRTNAILTKYTSLKSFYSKSIKGTPLDYENAGVYSSALLDAYMDYKIMWRNIQNAMWDVEQGQSQLVPKGDLPEFRDYSLQAKKHYNEQLACYQEMLAHYKREKTASTAPPLNAADSSTVIETSNGDAVNGDSKPTSVLAPAPASEAEMLPIYSQGPPLPPMPPNDLVPYKDTLFGLDKARRDCRFEMIKIVREVDAVAEDPKIACDPTRSWQYLSPAVFRMLLPTVKNLDKERLALLAADEERVGKEASAKAQEELRNNLANTQRKLEASEEKLRAAENAKVDAEKKLQTTEAEKKALNPYGGWCPVAVGTQIRFKSCQTGKCLDFNWGDGGEGGKQCHMWDGHSGNNQRFYVQKAGEKAFFIRHWGSDLCLAPATDGPNARLYMTFSTVPSPIVFENNGDGTVCIRPVEQYHYTLNVEGGRPENASKVIMWPLDKTNNDKWFVKAFGDLS